MQIPFITIALILSGLGLPILVFLAFTNHAYYHARISPYATRAVLVFTGVCVLAMASYRSGLQKSKELIQPVLFRAIQADTTFNPLHVTDTVKGYALAKKRQAKRAAENEAYKVVSPEIQRMNHDQANLMYIMFTVMILTDLIRVFAGIYHKRKAGKIVGEDNGSAG